MPDNAVTYALISDVHGNLHALNAVLEDAKTNGADRYLLLGDYVTDLPFAVEVTERIRNLPNAVIVRGNKEDYITDLASQDQSTWTYEQFAGIYWNYRRLTPPNRDYLMELPKNAQLTLPGGKTLHMSHSSSVFYRMVKLPLFHTSTYRRQMQAAAFDHAAYLAQGLQSLTENPQVMADIAALPDDVYAFGHNHLQWHGWAGGKLFVNPGSCGLPADGDICASYTLIHATAGGIEIIERRVQYDHAAAVCALEDSELMAQAEIWSRIVLLNLRTALEHAGLFFDHARAYANRNGGATWPLSNDHWRGAWAEFTPYVSVTPVSRQKMSILTPDLHS